MPPVQLASHAHATFIEVRHVGVDQLFFHSGVGGDDLLGDLGIGLHHSRFGQRMGIEVMENFRGP